MNNTTQTPSIKRTWFTSDTHYSHANIIRYSKRPFGDTAEMNKTLIDNHNALVASGDDVYHLGDFMWWRSTYLTVDKIREKLHGNIYLIRGNHDKGIEKYRSCFGWIKDLQQIEVQGQSIVLCHYAMRVWNKSHHGAWHLYGHSHGSLPDDPHSLSFDCGVDCHNYSPISFEQVAKIMAKKTWKSVDHHGAEQYN